MRLICKLLVSCLIVLSTIFAITLAALQTKYALPMVQNILKELTPYELKARSLNYNVLDPFSLSVDMPELLGPENQTRRKRYVAEYLSFSFSPFLSIKEGITFDNVNIRGLTLNQETIANLPENLRIQRLALDDLSYKSDALSFAGAKLQLSNWKKNTSKWGEGQGEFQFSAPQVHVKQQTLENVLLNSELQKDKWTLHGFSFNSTFGDVTGSATWHLQDQWIVHQLTLSDARIENTADFDALKQQWAQFNQGKKLEIKQLDLLNINVALPTFSIEGLNLSAQSLLLKQGKLSWAKNTVNSQLSFGGSLLRIKQWVLTDFLGDLSGSSDGIDLGSFSAKIDDDGFISFSGGSNANNLSLKSLTINELDLNLTPDFLDYIKARLSSFERIEIKKLDLKDATIYALEGNFPAQVIGLNISGHNLLLRKNKQYGMWHGEMKVKAAIANINHVTLSSFYANMSAIDGIWTLHPINLLFDSGELTASAEIDINNVSHAWSFKAKGKKVPNQLYSQWLECYFPVRGEHDVELSLSGLGTNKDSLAYSLTGQMKVTPYKAILKTGPSQMLNQALINILTPLNEKSKINTLPLKIEEIYLHANRGRIELAPVKINSQTEETQLSGSWDLVTQKGSFSAKSSAID